MKWFSVTLLKDHVHADVVYLKGEVIKVKEHVHDWLVKEGVIKATSPDAPTLASSTSKTAPAAAADQESTK